MPTTTILLFISLLTQSTLISYYSISYAVLSGVSIKHIDYTWVFVTMIHLLLPYLIGKSISKKIRNKNINNLLNLYKENLSFSIKSTLFYLYISIFNFIYINTFILGVLRIKNVYPFIIILLGDFMWYILVSRTGILLVDKFTKIQSIAFVLLILIVIYLMKKIVNKGKDYKHR